jgi:hypothetical protein
MRKKKHPATMTNEELAKHVFHPKVLEHAKRHLAELEAGSPKAKKPNKKSST